MMAQLITNTEGFKAFADVHKQTSWDSLRMYVATAETDFIAPLISPGIFNFLAAEVLAGRLPSGSIPEVVALYNKVCSALAHFAMYLALPFLNASVGDLGVTQQSSREGAVIPVAQWRFDSLRAAHLDYADSAADRVLGYLEAHSDLFIDWKLSQSYTLTKDLFISDSTLLSAYLNTQGSRRAYLTMRPWLRLAERKYLLPALGRPLFDEIKTELLSGNLSDNNTALLPFIREAAAWCSYIEALPHLSLKMTAEGFTIRTVSDGLSTSNSATSKEKQLAYSVASGNMTTFLSALTDYLQKNKEAYPLYVQSIAVKALQPNPDLKSNKKNSGHFRV